MLIFILLLFFVSFNFGMDMPFGKRKGDQLYPAPKFAHRIYGEPHLLGLPDCVIKTILAYTMSANASTPQEKITVTIKGIHPCIRANKKLNRLSSQVLKKLYGGLSIKYPDHLSEAVNQACIYPKRIPFLKRFIESAPSIVFNLTRRVTPLMVAVGYNNEQAVNLLLKSADENKKLKSFVDIKCDWKPDRKLGIPKFEGPVVTSCNGSLATALHLAVNNNHDVSVEIVKLLLDSNASPDSPDGKNATPLSWAIGKNSKSEAKVALLIEFGAKPSQGSTDTHGTPYERVEGVTQKERDTNYEFFLQLFTLRKNKIV